MELVCHCLERLDLVDEPGMKLFSEIPRRNKYSNERARELMTRAVAYAKAGEYEQAVKYFEWVLRSNPDGRQRADCYYWLSKISQDPDEKRSHLERVLVAEPSHFAARRDLAVLDGRLDVADLVNPSDLPQPGADPSHSTSGQRFFCPRCGGHMGYDASSRALLCEYCGEERPLAQALTEGLVVAEDDFIHALATARGHSAPRSTPTFECTACGAVYVLEATALSTTCPSCDSNYALQDSGERQLVQPQGIIPFQIKQSEARRATRRWLTDNDLADSAILSKLRGLYLPFWTFDISGEFPWRYMEYDGEEWVVETGSELVMQDDYPVVATHSLPPGLLGIVGDFRFDEMVTYAPDYIADWPAESYSIPASRAAMLARWQILESVKGQVHRRTPLMARDLQVSSPQLLVASYRLVLVPVWRGRFTLNGQSYEFLVNGQLGSVHAHRPRHRRKGLLGWLFG